MASYNLYIFSATFLKYSFRSENIFEREMSLAGKCFWFASFIA